MVYISILPEYYFHTTEYKLSRFINNSMDEEKNNIFYVKNTKDINGEISLERENIIYLMFQKNNEIKEKYRNEYDNLHEKTNEYLIQNNFILKKIIHKGGRKNNYDFLFHVYDKMNNIDKNIKIEYKHSVSFNKIPQFLDLANSSYPFCSPPYWEYFYKQYIDILREHIPSLPFISYKSYKSLVKKTFSSKNLIKYTKNDDEYFFSILYQTDINILKKISKESIEHYLKKYFVDSENTPYIHTKDTFGENSTVEYILQNQTDKIYLFFSNGKYNYYTVPDDFKLTNDITVDHNSIKIKTKNGNLLKITLRWKNKLCVSNPSWKFELIIKNKDTIHPNMDTIAECKDIRYYMYSNRN